MCNITTLFHAISRWLFRKVISNGGGNSLAWRWFHQIYSNVPMHAATARTMSLIATCKCTWWLSKNQLTFIVIEHLQASGWPGYRESVDCALPCGIQVLKIHCYFGILNARFSIIIQSELALWTCAPSVINAKEKCNSQNNRQCYSAVVIWIDAYSVLCPRTVQICRQVHLNRIWNKPKHGK